MKKWLAIILFLAGNSLSYSQECVVEPLAGRSTDGGDNGPVAQALFNGVEAAVYAPGGAIYLADTGNHRIRRLDPDGTVRAVAGTGQPGFSGDGGPALAATFRSPAGLALAPDGTLYVADTGNHRVRRITPDGIITTVAGDGRPRLTTDSGPALSVSLREPTRLAVDPAGRLYLLDRINARLRRLDPDGILRTLAGTAPMLDYGAIPDDDSSGVTNGTPALSVPNFRVASFALHPGGEIYLSDTFAVWRLDPEGRLHRWFALAPGAVEKPITAPTPVGQLLLARAELSVAADGTVYVLGTAQLVAIRNGVATRASSGELTGVLAMAIAPTGDEIFISAGGLIKFPPGAPWSAVWTYPDRWAQLPAPPLGSPIVPYAIASAPDGTLYIAEVGRIVALAPGGLLKHFAGKPGARYSGEVPATETGLSLPGSLAVARDGSLFFSDISTPRVGRIDPAGIVHNLPFSGSFWGWAPLAHIGVDAEDTVYGLFSNPPHVVRLASSGEAVSLVGPSSALWRPTSVTSDLPPIAVDPNGTVYAALNDQNFQKPSNIIRIDPGRPSQSVPVSRTVSITAMASAGDGTLYLGSSGGQIFRRSPDGTVNLLDGLTPQTSVKATGLALDRRGGLIVARSDNAYTTGSLVRIRLETCNPLPRPILNAVAESAYSSDSLSLAAGQLITLYGEQLGPAEPAVAQPGADGRYPVKLAGSEVLIDGIAAPLLYTSATQINAIVPFGLDGVSKVRVEVQRDGFRSGALTREIRRIAPAILNSVVPGYQPAYYARMLNQDGTINSSTQPAKAGSIVTIYVTGLGITTPAGEDGRVAGFPLKLPVRPVSVQVGGQDAEVLYMGTAPGIVEGVMQVNLRLPPAGSIAAPLESISIGGAENVPQPVFVHFYVTR